jgi:hypothetical protein
MGTGFDWTLVVMTTLGAAGVVQRSVRQELNPTSVTAAS